MAEDEVIDGEDNEEKKNEASKVRSTMHELGRKNLSSTTKCTVKWQREAP